MKIMKLINNDNWYQADKGKHFILTEKGKAEVASYRDKTVGEPTSDYDTQAVAWSVDAGYEIEVPIPDWVIKTGYEVVYNHEGYVLTAGNPCIFPDRTLAENYMRNYQNHPWFNHELYIREAVYEGRDLKPCKEHNGKQVYNQSWYYGTNALKIGDYVEQSIVDDLMNCLMPACMRSDCSQLGEPSSHRIDENDGKTKSTYATFKRIAEDAWEYCGDCFRGESVRRGAELKYI